MLNFENLTSVTKLQKKSHVRCTGIKKLLLTVISQHFKPFNTKFIVIHNFFEIGLIYI